jgi:hypothetical protein
MKLVVVVISMDNIYTLRISPNQNTSVIQANGTESDSDGNNGKKASIIKAAFDHFFLVVFLLW